ncbi:MAG: DUF998 domain-containing protein [Promethearchaeota archaeon]
MLDTIETIDRFFERVKGSYIVFIGTSIAMIFLAIAILTYYSSNPSFSIFSNFVSHIGLGPNISRINLLIGGTIIAITFAVYLLFFSRFLQKKGGNPALSWTAYFFSIVFGLSLISACIIPFDPSDALAYEIHILSAISLFLSLTLLGIFYGYSELLIINIPRIISLISFIAAIPAGLFTIFFTIQSYTNIPYQPFTYFIEWTSVFSLVIWAMIHGFLTLRK